ncbi:DUF551 domain-containing protein [Klebsiella sp. GG_Kp142]|uniref:DUF551 domain-containing protein n=1 Tax=Klebsiella sp. GG_Kp142 TaxID=3153453 RepID=UPI0032B5103D
MTKSTITRERLEKIKSWRETYGTGSNVMLPAEEAEELACLALAAMDSEPVAVVEPSDYVTAAQLVGEESIRKAVRELYEGALRIGDKLYRHAQPAPVVPEEITIETATIIAYGLPTTNIGAIFKAGHDACRAARLQAQAQNAPQNIPEIIPGWIPVSERMPEDSGRYWCYVEEQNDLGKSHYQWNCSWNGDRWWVESENGGIVTHWMPLPAAPQEVKSES